MLYVSFGKYFDGNQVFLKVVILIYSLYNMIAVVIFIDNMLQPDDHMVEIDTAKCSIGNI